MKPADWLSRALLVAFLALAFASGLTAVADGDIFWHLAAGRHMVETGRLLRADPFSTSALGRPWVDVHWLFQLGAHGVYRAGGLLALVLVKSALVALGGWLLLRVVAREDPRLRPLFAVTFVAALLLARHLLPVRPGILTLVLLAAFFTVLERARQQPRALLWLPALQLVWVNVQGLSALGPALVLAYLAGAGATAALGGRRWFPFAPEAIPWRPLALAFLACAAASFVSPYGIRAALLPFELLSRITPGANVFAREVAENIPPFVLERLAPEQVWHLKWYLGALALSFAAGRGQVRLSRLLVVGGLVTLALMAYRNVVLLYWLATPIAVMNAGPALERLRAHPRALKGLAALGAAALLALGGVAGTAVAREPSLRAPTPFRFPTESARELAARPGGGTVFAPDHHGGYLIWTLHPRFRPYLDTRLILRTADEFAEYLALLDHPERFDAFQARHRFDYVVLPTGYPDRYLGLVAHLARAAEWTLVHTDGSEILFARDGALPAVDLGQRATTDALLAELADRHTGPLLAAARLHLAKLDLVLGHLDQARAILSPMQDRPARALLARCYLLAGDIGTAETLARSLLVADEDDVASLNLLALAALQRGDTAEGLRWLRRALEVNPYDPEASGLLERLETPAAP